MKAYYLIVAIAASLAAIAMASQRHEVPEQRSQDSAEIDPETEAWFI